jgi:hypothetical protein
LSLALVVVDDGLQPLELLVKPLNVELVLLEMLLGIFVVVGDGLEVGLPVAQLVFGKLDLLLRQLPQAVSFGHCLLPFLGAHSEGGIQPLDLLSQNGNG